jgi:hypothetical protein
VTLQVEESPVETNAEQDWPYIFEVISLSELFIDKRYQRPLTNFWKDVRDNFNPAMVGTLVVAERPNGKYAVIDGQTRMEAMQELKLPNAPCLVYLNLRREQEAKLFADLQTKRRGMRTYDRFRAQLVAKDPDARAIARVATDIGFSLSVNEDRYTLKAIAALEKLYRKGEEHLAQVLEIIRDAWGTENVEAVSADMIAGVSWFLLHQERVDADRLVARLSEVTPGLIRHRASALREGKLPGSGSGLYTGQAIMNLYMSRRAT